MSLKYLFWYVIKQLETGDGLPGQICRRCLINVERVYEFKRQCEQSDALLREYFNKRSVMNDFEVDDFKLELENSRLEVVQNVMGQSDTSQSENEEDESGVDMKPVVSELTGVKEELSSYEQQSGSSCSTPIPLSATNNVSVHIPAFRCSVCNKGIIDQNRHDKHMKFHNQDGSIFPCEYCELEFSNRMSLRWHWRMHAEVGEISCMTCGEPMATRQAYDQHTADHNAVKRHTCQLCDRRFTTRSDLRKHVIIHTGVRPYTCKVCDKSFTRSTNLNKHTRSHLGDRPFNCPDCSKKFSTRGDLVRHSVTHSGLKPHVCPICGLAFSRRDKMNRHVGLHSKVRAFQCADCEHSFNNRKALIAHIGMHHSTATPDPAALVVVQLAPTG